MNDLILKIERLTSPSREIDAEIAAAIRYFPNDVGFIWKQGLKANSPEKGRVECETAMGTGGPHYSAPRYTHYIDAAASLLPDLCNWHLSGGMHRGYATIESGDDRIPDFTGNAGTPALALCVAALRARKALARQENET